MTIKDQRIRFLQTNKLVHLDLRKGFKKPGLLLSSIIILLITVSCITDSTYAKYIVDTIIPTGNEKYLNESSEYI